MHRPLISPNTLSSSITRTLNYSTPMPGIDASTARGQKRKRATEASITKNTTPLPPPHWKRGGFQSAEEANVVFWDNLSKVPICPPALKEFNRRKSSTSVPRPAAWVNHPVSRRDPSALKGCSVQLKRFARRGGPDLRDLRGCSESAESPSLSDTMPPKKSPYRTPSDSNQPTSQSRRRTSAYHPAFEQHLIKHGVYPVDHEYADGHTSVKPDNWEEIQQRMVQRRPSLSPSQFSDGAFCNFRVQTTRALDEGDVMHDVFPILRGEADILSTKSKQFGNLVPLTDSTIVDAKPDWCYGARPGQLNPHVKEQLSPYIVPSINQSAPILPNNSTEVKGPTGTWAVVDRQALYAGALGARAMQHLQSYGQPEPVYDNNAYTITSAFDGRYLEMYTTHPTQPANPGDQPEYHMNRLGSYALKHSPESFRQGATTFRNSRDWTKEKRDEFIKAANGRATSQPQNMSTDPSGYSQPSTSTNRATALTSDTSEDESNTGTGVRGQRFDKRLRRGGSERSRSRRQLLKRDRQRR